MVQSLGRLSRSQEKANHTSHITDIAHNQTASGFGCWMRHVRKNPSATRLSNYRSRGRLAMRKNYWSNRKITARKNYPSKGKNC
jgi:hypothetical protein